MLKRKDEMDEVIKGLSTLQFYLRYSSNKLGLQDINKMCEPFFCELFNILWNKEYQRLESEKKNHPAIDLGDKINKSSVQITTSGTKQKLWDTIKKFEDNELYVHYDELIHFVVGEKDYQFKEKDDVKFKKDNCGTYIVHKTIDEYKYSIRIIDLMDLIEFIDQLVGEKFSNIHDYIKNHIGDPVKLLMNNLYDIDPDELKLFTAESFLDFCEPESIDERNDFFIEIKNLANQINDMSENSKRFLYKILDIHQKNSQKKFDSVQIDPHVIQKRLDLSIYDMQGEIAVLRNAKLFNETAYEDEQMLGIEYYEYNGHFDYISTILQYCKEEGIDLKKLILTPDFSLLD
ncbi:SMEK domain-containing protein [Bacillus mycoides]|uniref:SMEK domain-containing protein n=1 Tax=Bacillus mycoides TaxID=1405 RepID=UPI001C5DC632|nr:SMEK domain-containing protein [Bacillus mycoides]